MLKIVLGQDNDLEKINLKILWNHRVRRIRLNIGKYGSIMPPHILPRKP